jgi:spermidine/putrescine transport system permease protein
LNQSPAKQSNKQPLAATIASPSLLAAAAWMMPLLFILVPIAGFVVFSFWVREDMVFRPALSLVNYQRWFAEPIYAAVFFNTLWLALGVMSLDLLIGYPIAWFITQRKGALRSLLLALLVAPLFISFVVRLYAMRSLMGSNGYIARSFESLGIDIPVTALLFNQTSIFITMVLVYLPFVVLPVYATLSKLPPNLLAASADLGARAGQTFMRITLPLSLPGSVVGAIFVAILVLGDFITPQMMGGTRGFTYGKLVWSQFGMAFEWPFGAAAAMMLFIVSLGAIALAIVIGRKGAVTL